MLSDFSLAQFLVMFALALAGASIAISLIVMRRCTALSAWRILHITEDDNYLIVVPESISGKDLEAFSSFVSNSNVIVVTADKLNVIKIG